MRINWLRRPALVLTAVALLGVSACGSDDGSSTIPSAAGDDATVEESAGGEPSDGGSSDSTVLRIGFITPLTGPSASTGIDARDGAQVAVDRWNSEDLLPGYTIELVVEDDAGTPETGALAYQKLHSQGIDIISGTMNSSVAIAIANATASDGDALYFISGAQTQEPLDEQSGNLVFGLQTTNAVFADANLSWIAETAKPQKVAVLVENSDFGVAEQTQIKEHWSSGNPEIALEEVFDRTQTDFSAILSKVRASGADGIYVGAAGVTFASMIFAQADELGMDVQKFMNAGLMSQALIDTGGDAVEGLTSGSSYHYSVDTPENEVFVEAFEAAHDGVKPTAHNDLGYDSINLILNAAKKVGSVDDVQAIADSLREGSWTTATGPMTFNDTGRALRPTFMVSVEGGELVLTDTIPAADK